MGADAGRRQAGSARLMVLAAVSMAGAWITGRDTGSNLGAGVESDHAHLHGVRPASGMTFSLLLEPQAPVLDDILIMSGLPARLDRRTLR